MKFFKLMLFYFTSFLFFAIVASCKKQAEIIPEVDPLTIPAKDPIGKWVWAYSLLKAPLSPTNPITPLNSGYTETIEFYSNTKWRLYTYGTLIDSGTYKIGRKKFVSPTNNVFIYSNIEYERNNSPLGTDYYDIKADTLIFDGSYCGNSAASLSLYYNNEVKKYAKQ